MSVSSSKSSIEIFVGDRAVSTSRTSGFTEEVAKQVELVSQVTRDITLARIQERFDGKLMHHFSDVREEVLTAFEAHPELYEEMEHTARVAMVRGFIRPTVSISSADESIGSIDSSDDISSVKSSDKDDASSVDSGDGAFHITDKERDKMEILKGIRALEEQLY